MGEDNHLVKKRVRKEKNLRTATTQWWNSREAILTSEKGGSKPGCLQRSNAQKIKRLRKGGVME